MTTASLRHARTGRIPLLYCIVAMMAFSAARVSAQPPAGRGRGNQRPAAPAAPTPAPPPPQVSAAGIRIVGVGLGANGSELRPFNESPGTVVALAVQAPRGSGIVQIDSRASQVDAFSDDKGQSLLEEARIGSFPKTAEDGSAAIVEVEVRARPSAGTASITVQGAIAMTLAGGSKPTRVAGVRLVQDQTFKVGTATMSIGEVSVDEEATKITLALTRSVLTNIREVRFFDAKNAPIEGRRTGSGYFNEKAELRLEAKTKEKTIAIEFELWQNLRQIKAPFTVQAGLGFAAGGRSSGPGDAPATGKTEPAKSEAAPPKPSAPPPVIGPTDGAASVEAVVKQLQTSALAGKGAPMLSVIYPPERVTFGQGVAMALAFFPMSQMGNEKAVEQLQKELDALFDKHKLKPPFTREPADLFSAVDLAAFVSDSMIFMKSHVKKGDKPEDVLPVPAGRPENVKITGDAAVATLSGKEINFTKAGGKWFIRLE